MRIYVLAVTAFLHAMTGAPQYPAQIVTVVTKNGPSIQFDLDTLSRDCGLQFLDTRAIDLLVLVGQLTRDRHVAPRSSS